MFGIKHDKIFAATGTSRTLKPRFPLLQTFLSNIKKVILFPLVHFGRNYFRNDKMFGIRLDKRFTATGNSRTLRSDSCFH